jgi:valyl-tRNA synthetase
MEKHYTPKTIEDKWYGRWMSSGAFHGDPGDGGDPYCIVIPPPNITGILHMGHALNITIQDILVRWRRMQGRNVVWMPGTDHAGIATQNVVERALHAEGKNREDLGRQAFVERVWEWREEYGNTIVNQLKRLGASCDWKRERFTMDEGLSDAVAEVFIRLYEKGLIYRASYIINWCPRCQTALSDEESEHADHKGRLYYIRYRLEGTADDEADHIVVATTRPETLLGDVAVAINPNDHRYHHLEGKTVRLPVLNRELAVIKDDFVDAEFGTGIVKVTPAHDLNDFEMGQRHGLTPINVMNGDGTMNEEAGPYAGLDRFECRRKLIGDLEESGLLEKVVNHKHAIGHCYRCDTIVEPRISPQWFVKMKPLAEPALEAVKSGKIKFTPARWTKVYLEWLENIRDWCISRQIWWGHRIPVYTCTGCEHEWAAKTTPADCPQCGATDIQQYEDVLDTWFSSWLWPFSTFGWPEDNEDLRFYYPTHDLATASEIIFFWVARMIMAGIEFMGDVPFRQVYIHGTVRDDGGKKMSKSLGNSLDPLHIIDTYSADALRYSLMMITATGQDVYVSNEKFEIGRNFGTKLWNAARFMTINGGDAPDDAWQKIAHETVPAFDTDQLRADDHYILWRLRESISACTANLEAYRINDAAHVLYEFVWHQFCDWHIEYARSVLQEGEQARRTQVLRIMHYVFSNALRVLHPMMPFITEELWHTMGYGNDDEFIMLASWPDLSDEAIVSAWQLDQGCVEYVDAKHELIRAGRNLKADYQIPASKQVDFIVKPADAEIEAKLKSDRDNLIALLKASNVTVEAEFVPDKAMPTGVSKLGHIYLPLDGVIDREEEVQRLTGKLDKVVRDLSITSAKLENQTFVSKAPPDVVQKQRDRREELLEDQQKLTRLIEVLGE